MGALIPKRLASMTAVAGMILALTACQTGGGSFCDIARPLRPSSETLAAMGDSEVADMLAHNEKGKRLCGWKA